MKGPNPIVATMWSGVDVLARQAIQFVVSVTLARLLSPEDFGTVAVIIFFIAVSSVIVDCGLSTALIQRQDVTSLDLSTIYWVNLLLATVLTVALCVCAPFIASVFNIPILELLIPTLALSLVITALGNVHSALLNKTLHFKRLLKIGAIASLSSGAVAVYLAATGFGIWSLIVQSLMSSVVTTTLLWRSRVWRPGLSMSLASFKKLFGFGKYLMLSALLEVLSSRMYAVIVGRFFGVSTLAYYSRAEGTKQLPAELVSSIVLRVTFPLFSAYATDRERLRIRTGLTARSLMLINVPTMCGIMVLAEPLVLTLFGDQWVESIPILQILCLAGMLWPLNVLNLSVLLAQGHSDLHFRLVILNKSIGIILMLVGVSFGVLGLAWSQVVISVLGFLTGSHFSKLKLGYGAVRQIVECVPICLISIGTAVLVRICDGELHMSDSTRLLLLGFIGSTSVLVGCRLFKLKAFEELRQLLAASRSASSSGDSTG